MGPQVTLYIPHGVLRQGANSVTLLELEAAPCLEAGGDCSVEFTDVPQIDGPVPFF